MRRIRVALRRLGGLFGRARRDREFADEIESHLQMHITDNLRAGMPPEDARRHALIRLGGIESVKGAYRDRRGLPALDALIQDVRFGFRMLRKNPGFTAIAVLTLALGIGANTAIFSVVDHAILRPLAYRDADRLFAVHEVVPRFSHIAPLVPVNGMHFQEWRRTMRSFEQMALVSGISVNLTGSGEPERLTAARVSPSLFSMLGVEPQLGRTFLEEEDALGRDRVVMLDDALWRRRFAADPSVIGRTITLDGQPYEIVGVLPAGFRFPKLGQLYAMAIAQERPQLWKPFALSDQEKSSVADFNFACIVRLRSDVSPSEALSELRVVQANLAAQISARVAIELDAALMPLQDQITGRSRTGLRLMLAAVAAVLLIGCVNIANLFLGRAADRLREMAIRKAVGASGARLVRQMLVESLLFSAGGGLLGVAIAYYAIRLLAVSAPLDLPRVDEIHLDARVLLFTVATSLLAGLLVGLLPAWRFAEGDPQEVMKSGSRAATAGRQSRSLRSLLVSLEVGLSAMCLIAAGLLLVSFVKLLSVDRGFEGQRVVAVDLSLPNSRYPDFQKDKAEFVRSMLDRVASLPGVASAGIVNRLPVSGVGGNSSLQLEGTKVPQMERPLADIRLISPAYFRAMGIPLRAGRIFDETSDRTRPIAVVSAMTAERVWPGQSPLGKRFRIRGDDTPLIEVVGIVGDVRGVSLNQPPNLTVYLPYWQLLWVSNQFSFSLVVRTEADPLALSPGIRAAIRQMDPELPVPAVRTMDEIVMESVAPRRFQMNLILLFGVAAALLASLGIYGVASYSVAQRTSEMGLRIALGAHPRNLRTMVLRQSFLPIAIGLGAGVMASIGLGRILESLLFGVSAADPMTISGVVVLLGAIAGVATYLPARRATRVDPVVALRYE